MGILDESRYLTAARVFWFGFFGRNYDTTAVSFPRYYFAISCHLSVKYDRQFKNCESRNSLLASATSWIVLIIAILPYCQRPRAKNNRAPHKEYPQNECNTLYKDRRLVSSGSLCAKTSILPPQIRVTNVFRVAHHAFAVPLAKAPPKTPPWHIETSPNVLPTPSPYQVWIKIDTI